MCRVSFKMTVRAVSMVTLAAFVLSDAGMGPFAGCAWAVPSVRSPQQESAQINDPRDFSLPPYLGSVKDSSFPPDGRRFVIHIQDAHCNYSAQHRIAEIIEYCTKTYGATTINLEGGNGNYDLTPFTSIREAGKRYAVSDYFVREGIVNGPEQYAIQDPGSCDLWGIEDIGLYVKNLAVYRDMNAHKEEIDKALDSLHQCLANLKRYLYTAALLEFDAIFEKYKKGDTDFKNYLLALLDMAARQSVDLEPYTNVRKLRETLRLEEGVDFKQADAERYELVKILENILAPVELEELVKNTVEFKADRITQEDFYRYLADKADSAKIGPAAYPELKKYVVYVTVYGAIDKSGIVDEIASLETAIQNTMFTNDRQRMLSTFSKNLALMRNLFGITLTREDYEYYKANKGSFEISAFKKFIDQEAPVHGLVITLDDRIVEVDQYREDMEKFFELSFERDETFLRNMRFDKQPDRASHIVGRRSFSLKGTNYDMRGTMNEPQIAILVTGGFHTANLTALFKHNNIAYVSIMPNFKSEGGYECPYFSLLAGKDPPILQTIMASASTLALYTHFCNGADDVNGKGREDALKVWVELVKAARGAEYAPDVMTSRGSYGIKPKGEDTAYVVAELDGWQVFRKSVTPAPVEAEVAVAPSEIPAQRIGEKTVTKPTQVPESVKFLGLGVIGIVLLNVIKGAARAGIDFSKEMPLPGYDISNIYNVVPSVAVPGAGVSWVTVALGVAMVVLTVALVYIVTRYILAPYLLYKIPTRVRKDGSAFSAFRVDIFDKDMEHFKAIRAQTAPDDIPHRDLITMIHERMRECNRRFSRLYADFLMLGAWYRLTGKFLQEVPVPYEGHWYIDELYQHTMYQSVMIGEYQNMLLWLNGPSDNRPVYDTPEDMEPEAPSFDFGLGETPWGAEQTRHDLENMFGLNDEPLDYGVSETPWQKIESQKYPSFSTKSSLPPYPDQVTTLKDEQARLFLILAGSPRVSFETADSALLAMMPGKVRYPVFLKIFLWIMELLIPFKYRVTFDVEKCFPYKYKMNDNKKGEAVDLTSLEQIVDSFNRVSLAIRWYDINWLKGNRESDRGKENLENIDFKLKGYKTHVYSSRMDALRGFFTGGVRLGGKVLGVLRSRIFLLPSLFIAIIAVGSSLRGAEVAPMVPAMTEAGVGAAMHTGIAVPLWGTAAVALVFAVMAGAVAYRYFVSSYRAQQRAIQETEPTAAEEKPAVTEPMPATKVMPALTILEEPSQPKPAITSERRAMLNRGYQLDHVTYDGDVDPQRLTAERVQSLIPEKTFFIQNNLEGSCSGRCRWCCTRRCVSLVHRKKAHRPMALETAKRIVDQALALGFDTIALNGEDTLDDKGRDTFWGIIEACQGKPIRVAITTNGFYLLRKNTDLAGFFKKLHETLGDRFASIYVRLSWDQAKIRTLLEDDERTGYETYGFYGDKEAVYERMAQVMNAYRTEFPDTING
ncbi:MAG: hypothetical protein PHS37_04015, partial [Candidatus Omnitrophica bacterium]|nr:hypothetical protein [Candidatus Omnitrophota bacterium]